MSFYIIILYSKCLCWLHTFLNTIAINVSRETFFQDLNPESAGFHESLLTIAPILTLVLRQNKIAKLQTVE